MTGASTRRTRAGGTPRARRRATPSSSVRWGCTKRRFSVVHANLHRFSTRDARFCQCKIPGFSVFFPEEIHRRTCVVVAARHSVGRARGRGRQPRATPPEVSPESERKSRTLSPSNTRCPSAGWRGYDSVPKSNPSTFGHHLFAKGSRTGTPPRGRPTGNSSRGDSAVSRAETDILSTYMRGALGGQRGDTLSTSYNSRNAFFDQKCPLFCRIPCTTLFWDFELSERPVSGSSS